MVFLDGVQHHLVANYHVSNVLQSRTKINNNITICEACGLKKHGLTRSNCIVYKKLGVFRSV